MSGKEAALVGQLLEKTVMKAIPWEATAQFDHFGATVSNVTFTISRYDETYTLEMRDSQYREMLRINSEASRELRSNLAQLYDAARDSALRVDETIDSILDDLRKVS